jgi:glycosyltransferase involved in cell wall biosynthesis
LAEPGGVVTLLASLVPALTEHFDVTVAAHGPGPLGAAARAAGADFVALRHVRRPVRPLRDVLGLLELIRLCRRVRPHVLHANSAKAGLVGRLAAWLVRVPIRFFNPHGWAFATHPGRTSWLYLWGDRLMRPLTTVTICVSNSELQRGIKAGTCTADRTAVIPNGVDPGRSRLTERPGEGAVKVLSVGRLAPPKDFITMARALALLPRGTFSAEIVGEGRGREALEAEIRRWDLAGAVTLAGERLDVTKRLLDCDIFVLSTFSEGLPMTVLEAMAAGLPVVASAVGGIPELVVDGETGLTFRAGDADALAAALARLLDDPALRRRLGAAGRARLERVYSLDACRRAHVELYWRELAVRGLIAAGAPPSGATTP